MIFPFPDLLDGFRGLETFRKRTKTTKRTVECPTGQTITLKGLQTNQILRFRIISGKIIKYYSDIFRKGRGNTNRTSSSVPSAGNTWNHLEKFINISSQSPQKVLRRDFVQI